MSDKFAAQYEHVSSQNYGKYAQKVEVVNGVPSIIRFLSLPNGFMSYFESWILCDDDVKRPFIIKNEAEKSILYDIIGDRDNFYKGGFLEAVLNPKTRKPQHIWQMKDPELFNLVMYNNNLSNADGSWKSRQQYAFNVILRNLTAIDGKTINWCQENKHSMLLTLIPAAFKSLGDLRLLYGNPSEYDVVYTKSGTGLTTTHAMSKGDPVEFREVFVGELSDEEKTYSIYDLKKEVSVTKASTILRRLGTAIEKLSSVMGIDWIGQLEQQEANENEESGATSNITPPRDDNFVKVTNSPAPVASTRIEPTTAQPVEPVPVTNSNVSQPVPDTTAPKVAPMSRVTRVPITTQPQPQVETEACYYCNAQTPKGSITCESCGNVLMEPCAIPECNKLFHVSLNKCPHCGQEYGQDIPADII